MRTVDLFCGMGGASDGLRTVGMSPVGFEWDATACVTHHAAGHATVRADLRGGLPVAGPVGFLWASPPCTAFSVAGKKHGTDLMPDLLDAAYRGEWWAGPKIHDDPDVWLALSTFGTVDRLRPEMLACEQVPGVLPLWQAFGRQLDGWGYHWWAGVLNCADFGVPQTRRRAILMASSVGLANPPVPTHAEEPGDTLFGATSPWVTMAQALGWGGKWLLRELRGGERTMDEPSLTITVSHDNGNLAWHQDAEGSIRITVRDALILQGFDPDRVVYGSKTAQFRQVGNAVPPPLAAAVAGALLGG